MMFENLSLLVEKIMKKAKSIWSQFSSITKRWYILNEFWFGYKIRLTFYKVKLKIQYRFRAPRYRFKLNELLARLRFFEKGAEETSFYTAAPNSIYDEGYKTLQEDLRTRPTKIFHLHFSNTFQAPKTTDTPLYAVQPPIFMLGRLNPTKVQLISRRLRRAIRLQLKTKLGAGHLNESIAQRDILFITLRGSYKEQVIKRIISFSQFNKFFATTNLVISAQIRSQELYWHRIATPYHDYCDASLYFKKNNFIIEELSIFFGIDFFPKLNTKNHFSGLLPSRTSLFLKLVGYIQSHKIKNLAETNFIVFFYSCFSRNLYSLGPRMSKAHGFLQSYYTLIWLQRFLNNKLLFKLWLKPNGSYLAAKGRNFSINNSSMHPRRQLNKLHEYFLNLSYNGLPILYPGIINAILLRIGSPTVLISKSNYIVETEVARNYLNLFSFAPYKGLDDPVLYRRSFAYQYLFWFLVHRGAILMYISLYRYIFDMRNPFSNFYQKYIVGNTSNRNNYWLTSLGPLKSFYFNHNTRKRILPLFLPRAFTIVTFHSPLYKLLTTKVPNIEISYKETSFFPVVSLKATPTEFFKLPILPLVRARYGWYAKVLKKHSRTILWDEYVYGMWFTRTKSGFQPSEIDYRFNQFYREKFEMAINEPVEEMTYSILPGTPSTKKLLFNEFYRTEQFFVFNETSHLFFDWTDYYFGPTPRFFAHDIIHDTLKMENADWVFPLPYAVLFESWILILALYILPNDPTFTKRLLPDIYYTVLFRELFQLEDYWTTAYTRSEEAPSVFDAPIDISVHIVWEDAVCLLEDLAWHIQSLISLLFGSVALIVYSYLELLIFKFLRFTYFTFKFFIGPIFTVNSITLYIINALNQFFLFSYSLIWIRILAFTFIFWLTLAVFELTSGWLHIVQFVLGGAILGSLGNRFAKKLLNTPDEQRIDDLNVMEGPLDEEIELPIYFIGSAVAVGWLVGTRPSWPYDIDRLPSLFQFFYKGATNFTLKMIPNRADQLKWFWFHDTDFFLNTNSNSIDWRKLSFNSFHDRRKRQPFESFDDHAFMLHSPYFKKINFGSTKWFREQNRDNLAALIFWHFYKNPTPRTYYVEEFNYFDLFVRSTAFRLVHSNLYGAARSTAPGLTYLTRGAFGHVRKSPFVIHAVTPYSHSRANWYDVALKKSKNHVFLSQTGLRQWGDYEARRVRRRNYWEKQFDNYYLYKWMLFRFKKHHNYSNYLLPTYHRRIKRFNPFFGDYGSLLYYSPRESRFLTSTLCKLLGYSEGLITRRERAINIDFKLGFPLMSMPAYGRKSPFRQYAGPIYAHVEYHGASWLATHTRRTHEKNANLNRGQIADYVLTITDERHFIGGFEGITAGNLPEPVFSQWRTGSMRGRAFDCSIAANTLENAKPYSTSRTLLRFLSVLAFFRTHFFNFPLESISDKQGLGLTVQFGNTNFAMGYNYASVALPLSYFFDFSNLNSPKSSRLNSISVRHLRNHASDHIVLTRGFNFALFERQAIVVPNYYYAQKPFHRNWWKPAMFEKKRSWLRRLDFWNTYYKPGQPHIFHLKKRYIQVDPPPTGFKYFFIPSFLRPERQKVWPIVRHYSLRTLGSKTINDQRIHTFQSVLANKAQRNRTMYYRLWWGMSKEPRFARVHHFFFRKIVKDLNYSFRFRRQYTNYSALYSPRNIKFKRIFINHYKWMELTRDSATMKLARKYKKVPHFRPLKYTPPYYNKDKYRPMPASMQYYQDLFAQHRTKWFQSGAHKVWGANYTIDSRNSQARNFLTESVFGSLDRIPYGWDYTFVLIYLQFERNLFHLLKVLSVLLDTIGWAPDGLCAVESDWLLPINLFWFM